MLFPPRMCSSVNSRGVTVGGVGIAFLVEGVLVVPVFLVEDFVEVLVLVEDFLVVAVLTGAAAFLDCAIMQKS